MGVNKQILGDMVKSEWLVRGQHLTYIRLVIFMHLVFLGLWCNAKIKGVRHF